MTRHPARLLFIIICTLALFACSTQSSSEACKHQASMDLDAGRYDAVIASSCADAQQKGAAYFGRAGFDPASAINIFAQTGSSSGPTSTQPAISTYLTRLVSVVSNTSLSDLDSSIAQYDLASQGLSTSSPTYQDAQFSLGIVDIVDSLSLLKLMVSDATGSLSLGCDVNANGAADNADAGACAMIAATNATSGTSLICSNATYSPAAPVETLFTGKTGTYSGLFTTLTGTATSTCPVSFKSLLYRNASGWGVAATDPTQSCQDNTGASWPCPIERSNVPLDLVTAINLSMDNSIIAIGNALPAGQATDVQTAITSIKSDACPLSACTATSIAAYLLTIH
jgi:hypothetical protein